MDLNIRNFPEEVLKHLKREALEGGKTLREVVIEKCTESSLSWDVVSTSADSPQLTKRSGSQSRKTTTLSTGTKSSPVEKVDVAPAESPTELSVKPLKPLSEMTDIEIRRAVRNGEL